MADLTGPPDPAGSPNEKLTARNSLENIGPMMKGILTSENPTREEILTALTRYNELVQRELTKQNRDLELWANIHTHPGGGTGGFEELPEDIWTLESTGYSPFNESRAAVSTCVDSNGNLYFVNASNELEWVNLVSGVTGTKSLGFVVANHASVAVISDLIYISFRYSFGDTNNKFLRYDPSDDSLTELVHVADSGLESSSSRSYGQIIAHQDKIFHFSSTIGGPEVYNPLTQTWTGDPDWPQHPAGAGSRWYQGGLVSSGDVLYAFGGTADSLNTAISESYKLEEGAAAWEQISTIPFNEARAGINTVYLSGLIWLWGGWGSGNANKFDDTVWRYDPSTDTYTALTDHPNVTKGGYVGAYENHLYVLGGQQDTGGQLGSLYKYG